MSIRSPANAASKGRNNNLEDVELGSSSHGHQRRLKAKDSDLEMTALISGNDNGGAKSPINGNAPASGSEGESGSLMKSLIASAMYSGCSVGMVLVNKSLASR